MAFPEPKNGLVISYSYLWRHEQEAGREEGVKNRPCAIVLVVKSHEDTRKVTVAPITHTLPHNPDVAIEIPLKVKQYLGLDNERSWIILDDFNEFVWPGFDLHPLPGKPGCYEYGLLPPVLFRRIINKVFSLKREGRGYTSSRDLIT